MNGVDEDACPVRACACAQVWLGISVTRAAGRVDSPVRMTRRGGSLCEPRTTDSRQAFDLRTPPLQLFQLSVRYQFESRTGQRRRRRCYRGRGLGLRSGWGVESSRVESRAGYQSLGARGLGVGVRIRSWGGWAGGQSTSFASCSRPCISFLVPFFWQFSQQAIIIRALMQTTRRCRLDVSSELSVCSTAPSDAKTLPERLPNVSQILVDAKGRTHALPQPQPQPQSQFSTSTSTSASIRRTISACTSIGPSETARALVVPILVETVSLACEMWPGPCTADLCTQHSIMACRVLRAVCSRQSAMCSVPVSDCPERGL